MVKSIFCYYSNVYILFKETKSTEVNTAADANAVNGVIKVILKNLAPFTYGINEIKNTQVNNAKDIGVVIPMCNLIKYSDNYSKIQ